MENLPLVTYFRYHPSDRIREAPEGTLDQDNIVFVLDGEMTYFINGEPVTVSGGSALYIKSGDHRRRDDAAVAARYYSAMFSGGDAHDTERLSPVFRFSGVSGIMWCLSMIDRATVAPFEQGEDCERRVSILFALLLNLCVEASLGTVDSPYVEEVISYIRDNYKSKLRIPEIARHVHLNPSYLSTVFRQKTGTTIGDFITKYRFDMACDELSAGSTVREAGEAIGFTDPYNFSKWFRQNAGMPPSEYRARRRSNGGDRRASRRREDTDGK